MMRSLRSFTFLPLLALTGCTTYEHVQSLLNPQATVLTLGTNLVEEACQAVPLPKNALPQQAESVYAIQCGDWAQPSGFVVVAQDAADAQPEWWRENLSRRMKCPDAGDAAPLFEGEEATLYACALNAGDWPYVALSSRIDGTQYLADGVPVALPVLERTIGLLSGRLDAETIAEQAESAGAKLPSKLQGAGDKYGAGDLQTYKRLMERGLYFNSRGHAAAAEQEFREALAVQEATLGEGSAATAEPMVHLALEISNQGRTPEAEALFQRASKLVEQTGERGLLARYLAYYALHKANARAWDDAETFMLQATKIRTELAVREQRRSAAASGNGPAGGGDGLRAMQELIQSLAMQTALYTRMEKFDLAGKALQQAKARLASETTAPSFWPAELARLEADLAAAQGNLSGAQAAMQRAVSGWSKVDGKARPVATGYLGLGALLSENNSGREALAAFAQSAALLNETGESVKVVQILPYLDALYKEAQANEAVAPANMAAMFDAAQFIRDGLTARSIAMATARLSASDADAGVAIRDLQEAQRMRTQLQDALSAQFALDPGLRNATRVAELKQALEDVDQTIEALGMSVQSAAPSYNKLVDTPARAERVQKLLKPDEALLQVVFGEKAGYGFYVTSEGVTAWPIAQGEADISRQVRRLRTAFAPKADGTMRPYDTAAALALYNHLFGPMAEDAVKRKHMIVVPQGALLSLPFGALVTAEAKEGKTPYLGAQVALSLNPSVRAFADLRSLAKPSQAPKAFLGLGDFQPPLRAALEKAQMADTACPEMQNLLELMTPLPETADEVTRIAARFAPQPTQTLLANDFTEEKMLAQNLADYRVLYFATHGLLPTDLRCQAEASLVLSSPPDAAGSESFLDAGEIQALKMDADLVVLSACNTGGGGADSRGGGESLSGLARAFFYAGARSLLVSHWSVASRETVDLMTQLFAPEATAAGGGLAEAMRLSQVAMIARGEKNPKESYLAHPFFWAPFTLVGDGRTAKVF